MKIKKHSVFQLVLIDLVCIGIGLNVFALFHHVLDFSKDEEPVTLPTASVYEQAEESPAAAQEIKQPETAEPAMPAEETPAETPEEPVPTRNGRWGDRFAEQFTDGEVLQTEDSYRSENISVTVRDVEENGVIYHVAEIYISDLQYLKTGFGRGGYKKGTEKIKNIAQDVGAIIAITGDHYGARAEGTVVRNGVLYRDSSFEDVAVLTNDGELLTFTAEQFKAYDLETEGAWQVWSFGPMLLENGEPMTKFNSSVTRANPRSAIGCVEPGHYFFVQVDGRIKTSKGMTMEQLSQLFYDLGCKAAYNLDGGQTSAFCWLGELRSFPYGRDAWDIIYIGE